MYWNTDLPPARSPFRAETEKRVIKVTLKDTSITAGVARNAIAGYCKRTLQNHF